MFIVSRVLSSTLPPQRGVGRGMLSQGAVLMPAMFLLLLLLSPCAYHAELGVSSRAQNAISTLCSKAQGMQLNGDGAVSKEKAQ